MSASTIKKKCVALVCVTIAVGGLLSLISSQEIAEYERFEFATWDMRLKRSADADRREHSIKIIDIDQRSLTQLADEDGQAWPWPRSMYVPILEFLKMGGAKGIAFDMLYTESKGTEAYKVEDEQLAEAIANTIPTILAVSAENHDADRRPQNLPRFLEKLKAQDARDNISGRFLEGRGVREYTSVLAPVPELMEAAAGFGIVNPLPDSDGTYRHYVPGVRIGGAGIGSLAFSLFAVAYPKEARDLSPFIDSRGRLPMKFHGGRTTFTTYPFVAVYRSFGNVLEGKPPLIDPAEFRDALVFLGTSAPGLMDLRVSPMDYRFPGVEVNATALDNLIGNRFVRKTPLLFDVLMTMILTAITSAIVLFVFRGRLLYLLLILLALTTVAVALFATDFGWWIPMMTPLLAMATSMVLSLAFQYQLEGKQHRFIKDAFKFYVSPTVIDKIIEDPGKLSLGGERRELTIYFSDIAGFTTLSESMDPTKLVVLLNTYLSAMTDIIMASGGTVDKYEGDAIIAFWNAPLTVDDHAYIAVKGALRCQAKLREMQPQFQADFGAQLKMRIGLNSGVVSVGNFGSSERFNYTMIGDAANLASRLEGVNKVFGTLVMISDATRNHFGERIFCREIGGIRVVGKSNVVKIYEPISELPTDEQRKEIEMFDIGRIAFEERRFDDARKIFSELPEDPVAKTYLRRLDDLGTVDESWSPVWNMTEK